MIKKPSVSRFFYRSAIRGLISSLY